jgi:hypothetical protein
VPPDYDGGNRNSKQQAAYIYVYLYGESSWSLRYSESYVTTDGQSASLSWNKAPIWGFRQLRVCWRGAPSLTRGRVCRLQLLLALASAVILGSESRETRDNILLYQFLELPFVASYDSQGYGGGIRPRLHMGYRSAILYIYYIKIEFLPHRKHITSPLQSRIG